MSLCGQATETEVCGQARTILQLKWVISASAYSRLTNPCPLLNLLDVKRVLIVELHHHYRLKQADTDFILAAGETSGKCDCCQLPTPRKLPIFVLCWVPISERVDRGLQIRRKLEAPSFGEEWVCGPGRLSENICGEVSSVPEVVRVLRLS